MPSESVKCYWQVTGYKEILSIRWNELWFLPSRSCVHTTIRMHRIDTNKTNGEKARQKLHQNATYCLKQMLKATSQKTAAALWLHASHLTYYSSKTSKTCRALLKNQNKLMSRFLMDSFLHMDAPLLTDQQRLTFLHVDAPILTDQQRLTYIRFVRTQDAISNISQD